MWQQYFTGVAVGVTVWTIANLFTIVNILYDPIGDTIDCGSPGCNQYTPH